MSSGVVKDVPTLEPMRYPEQDPKLASNRFWDLLSIVGPGFIMASVTIGNGEVFQATRGGAIFGYGLLWTFLFGAIMKASVVYAGGRYIALTGEHPFARFGHITPGGRKGGIAQHWFATFLGILSVVCFPAWSVAYILALSQLIPWAFGMEPMLWVGILLSMVAWATIFIPDFSFAERLQGIIVGLLVFFALIALFTSGADWLGVLKGMVPNLNLAYPDWVTSNPDYEGIWGRPVVVEVIAYLGALGGGVYDYIGYIGTFREKGWGMLGRTDTVELQYKLQSLDMGHRVPIAMDEENLKVGAWGLKAVKIDTVVSFTAVALFALTFMVLGAVVLGDQGLREIPTSNNIIQAQANFFTQINPALMWLYVVALFSVFWGSQQALLTAVYPYTFREAFAPAFPKLADPLVFRKLKLWLSVYILGGAIILALTGVSYTQVISFAGILGGVFGLGIWGFMQVYMDKKMLPERLQMKTFMVVLVLFSSAVLLIMGFIALLGFFGINLIG